MDDVFILNPSVDQIDIADAIDERLQKVKLFTKKID